MTANRGLFVKQLGTEGTTPLEARRALAGLFAENSPGVPRSGLLEPSTPSVVTGASNMSYNIAPIAVVMNRAATEGVYVFTTTGVTNVVTTAAPGTDKRWDLIWIKQLDPDKSDTLNGALSNKAIAGVVQGSVSGSPSKPYAGVPDGAYVLAESLVSAGATSTNNAAVTISNVWDYAAFRGTAIWVRDVAERDEITPHIGQRVQNLTTGYNERWNGSSWVPEKPPLRAAIFTVSQPEVPNGMVWGPGMPDQDAARSINGNFAFFSENDWISVQEEGLYSITFVVEIAGGFGNAGFLAIQNLQQETLATAQGTAVSGGLSTTCNVWLKPGTQKPAGVVKFLYYHNNGKTSAAKCRVQIMKVV